MSFHSHKSWTEYDFLCFILLIWQTACKTLKSITVPCDCSPKAYFNPIRFRLRNISRPTKRKEHWLWTTSTSHLVLTYSTISSPCRPGIHAMLLGLCSKYELLTSSSNVGRPTRTASAEKSHDCPTFDTMRLASDGESLVQFSSAAWSLTDPIITNTTPIKTQSKPSINSTVLLQMGESSTRLFLRYGIAIVVIPSLFASR